MLTIIGFIILGLIVFVAAGLLGWILELIKFVFEILWMGVTKIFSCLFWVIIIFCLYIVLFY